VTAFAKIEHGKPGQLCFYANPKYEHYVYTSRASVLLVNQDFKPAAPVGPTLVRVENAEIKGYNNRKVYAVYDDRDAGNGVNNTIILDGKHYTLRQSALSSFSSEPIPQGKVNVTAVLTRYGDTWQFTLRSADDVTPAE